MPAPHLTALPDTGTPPPDDDLVADAVLTVLAGTPLRDAATHTAIAEDDLVDAVAVYHHAGRAALKKRADRWVQVWLQFCDWADAEPVTASLALRLDDLVHTGILSRWWYIRKHPSWRLRLQPPPGVATDKVRAAMTPILDSLTRGGHLTRWRECVYEPETLAFGGPAGMDIAHTLFHHDSHTILTAARHTGLQPGLGRPELSVLLVSALFRAAGQDRYEQGDIWHRVTALRPSLPDTAAGRVAAHAAALRTLIFTDRPASPPRAGP